MCSGDHTNRTRSPGLGHGCIPQRLPIDYRDWAEGAQGPKARSLVVKLPLGARRICRDDRVERA
jgi:hypothetical protein